MTTQRGFTLIEVMVALAIASMAIPALLMLITQQIEDTGAIREKTYAYWVAENQLTRLRLQHELSGVLPTDETDGETDMAGQTWLWTIEPEDTELGLLTVYRIEVFTPTDPESSIATLETYFSG